MENTFETALTHLKEGGFAQRKIIKNDTVICLYKDKLTQLSRNTGVRYSYTLSSEDILSNDWMISNGKEMYNNKNQ